MKRPRPVTTTDGGSARPVVRKAAERPTRIAKPLAVEARNQPNWQRMGWEQDEALDILEIPDAQASSGITRLAGSSSRPPRPIPEPIAEEIHQKAGVRRGVRLQQRLADATGAFERERYGDALRMLRPLAEEAPDVAAIRELVGLCLYRQGKWLPAARELEAFVELTGSAEQNPVLADCYRALRRFERVDDLWRDLAESSPSAELVAEGRIVTAGALADQGRLGEAIALLERAPLAAKRPRDHHLRMWYALGDLYERAGDVPRARDTFARIASHDAAWVDVVERLAALG